MQGLVSVGKSEAALEREMLGLFPDVPKLPHVKRQLLDYQMEALYGVARQYDREGAKILEIGTGHGASGYVLSKAAPRAQIMSLTTNAAEAEIARDYWRRTGCINVKTTVEASWDTLKRQRGARWAMVFVDGDHNRIGLDMGWFNRLILGGLFLCHDYSPADSAHPSPVVYRTLASFALELGRGPDVLVVDDMKTGMAGFYRREGEKWR